MDNEKQSSAEKQVMTIIFVFLFMLIIDFYLKCIYLNSNKVTKINVKLYILQLKETQEKLKSESEAASRLRKQHAEITVALKQKETAVSDYNEKLQGAQSVRDTLEREVFNLQTQLERLKAQKMNQEENKRHQLQAKVN